MCLVFCSGCGHTFCEFEGECPKCARRVSRKQERRKRRKEALFFAIFFLLFSVFVWALGTGAEEEARQDEGQARDQCYQSWDCNPQEVRR